MERWDDGMREPTGSRYTYTVKAKTLEYDLGFLVPRRARVWKGLANDLCPDMKKMVQEKSKVSRYRTSATKLPGWLVDQFSQQNIILEWDSLVIAVGFGSSALIWNKL